MKVAHVIKCKAFVVVPHIRQLDNGFGRVGHKNLDELDQKH